MRKNSVNTSAGGNYNVNNDTVKNSVISNLETEFKNANQKLSDKFKKSFYNNSDL